LAYNISTLAQLLVLQTRVVAVWAHPDVEVRTSTIEGHGLFACAPIAAGTVVLRLDGRLVSTAELDALFATPHEEYIDTITVDEDVHLVLPPGTIAHHANHSCDPNLWHEGPYEIVARRDIAAGAELTVDYATNSGAPGFVMACRCGAASCRGEITSDDWRLPELQARYRGHWVPALAERIRQQGGR